MKYFSDWMAKQIYFTEQSNKRRRKILMINIFIYKFKQINGQLINGHYFNDETDLISSFKQSKSDTSECTAKRWYKL